MSQETQIATSRYKKRKKTDVRTAVRGATAQDLDCIMEIEHASFPIPWSKEAMGQEIDGREWSRVFVATLEASVVGFMVYWIIVNELHLLNLAVHPNFRRRGVGRAMIQHLIDTMENDNMTSAILEVRVSNRVAQKLYRSFGFTPMARRVNYYTDNGEDAVVMCLRRR